MWLQRHPLIDPMFRYPYRPFRGTSPILKKWGRLGGGGVSAPFARGNLHLVILLSKLAIRSTRPSR